MILMTNKKDEPDFRIIDLNEANIDDYGAFCMQSKRNTKGYNNKLNWMKERFKEGLRVKLLMINEGAKRGFRARGFIEYIPGEHAWRGVNSKGFMFIHCVWVVGRNKGHGYGTMLLQKCLDDAKGMNGVAVMTSEKTWLPKKHLFVKNGFEKADAMLPYFELYAKRFSKTAPLPRFNLIPESRLRKYASGITIFKSDQCPYTDGYANLVAEIARQKGVPVRIEQVKTCEEAQNGVYPYGSFCVLFNGKVLTHRSIGRKELLEVLKGA